MNACPCFWCISLTLCLSRLQETDSNYNFRPRSIISEFYGITAGTNAAIIPHSAAGIEIAVHAVKITLRLAFYVKTNCLFVEHSDLTVDSWSLNVTGLQKGEAEVLLEDFVAGLVRIP
jgi:hypothetical protein